MFEPYSLPSPRHHATQLRTACDLTAPDREGHGILQLKLRFLPVMLWVMLAAILAASRSAFSQSTTFGEINGTVTDSAGGVIPKAEVTAVNVETNEVFKAESNGSGQYRIANLLPAQYSLTIVSGGFKTITLGPFKLNVGQALTQNAMLPIGNVSETVNVAVQGALLAVFRPAYL